ncbi:hypothetical protein Plhal304r1_c003g0010891 [Plasmopara halstedii]
MFLCKLCDNPIAVSDLAPSTQINWRPKDRQRLWLVWGCLPARKIFMRRPSTMTRA